MPKKPILSRESYYDRLRDGSFFDLDWNLVNTSVGPMIEPRQIKMGDFGQVVNRDVYDASFTRRVEMDEDVFFSLYGTAGRQLPSDFNA